MEGVRPRAGEVEGAVIGVGGGTEGWKLLEVEVGAWVAIPEVGEEVGLLPQQPLPPQPLQGAKWGVGQGRVCPQPLPPWQTLPELHHEQPSHARSLTGSWS